MAIEFAEAELLCRALTDIELHGKHKAQFMNYFKITKNKVELFIDFANFLKL
ncbi:MAG: hypothetical protein JXQ65_07990 [Candidatus Marinimicrobia bacterium]|nr:hypothetical protein [Candidatus Neomarinimicrobiota bacterium]